MSHRGILMPVRLTDLVAAPPSRGTNLRVALAALVLVVTAFSSVAMVHFAAPGSGGQTMLWREIAWPFPRDGWPAGRAFRCDACGGGLGGERGGVELYVRPKIGFCNCTTGVADDDEVDRVADLDLISPQFAPREAGRAVRVGNLSGRARVYDLAMADGTRHAAIGIALSQRCDLLVAVAHGNVPAVELQRVAFDHLASHELRRWTTAALGAREGR
jgi:hypothetical protein